MPKLTERPLAPMQARFVDEYLVDLNASAAAARAGYSPRTCGQLGHRMLKNARIQAAIAEKARTATAKVDLQTEDVLRELVLMLRSDVRHFTVDEAGELTLAHGAPADAWRAVSSVKRRVKTNRDGSTVREIEYRLWSKPDAARMSGEYLKLFTQKTELSAPAGSGVLAVPMPVDAAQWAAMAALQQAALAMTPALAEPSVPT
jgi:phage terminase small subunit